MTYLHLALEFFKTGLFSIGGGLATLPFLYEISAKTGWFTSSDIADMIAVSESTPGAIGINMSTFAGYLTGGVLGGIVATFSLAAPSVLIILTICQVLDRFRDNPTVENAFYGFRPASVAMISAAGFQVCKIAFINLGAFAASHNISDLFIWKGIALAALIFFLQHRLKWGPVQLIGLSAVIGMLFRFAGA